METKFNPGDIITGCPDRVAHSYLKYYLIEDVHEVKSGRYMVYDYAVLNLATGQRGSVGTDVIDELYTLVV